MLDELSQQYITLIQRLGITKDSGVVSVAAGFQPLDILNFMELLGQQAFRIVTSTATLFDPLPSSKLVAQNFSLAILSKAGPIYSASYPASDGLVLGQEGIFVSLRASPLFFWNDFLAAGGLAGTITVVASSDINNTDGAAHDVQMTMTGLIELYQVSTSALRGLEALGFQK